MHPPLPSLSRSPSSSSFAASRDSKGGGLPRERWMMGREDYQFQGLVLSHLDQSTSSSSSSSPASQRAFARNSRTGEGKRKEGLGFSLDRAFPPLSSHCSLVSMVVLIAKKNLMKGWSVGGVRQSLVYSYLGSGAVAPASQVSGLSAFSVIKPCNLFPFVECKIRFFLFAISSFAFYLFFALYLSRVPVG